MMQLALALEAPGLLDARVVLAHRIGGDGAAATRRAVVAATLKTLSHVSWSSLPVETVSHGITRCARAARKLAR
jgi:putative intracellular protease/amidase